MEELFEKFIIERRYLKNITDRTEYSYRNAKKAFFKLYGTDFAVADLSKEKLSSWIVRMGSAGLSPAGATCTSGP